MGLFTNRFQLKSMRACETENHTQAILPSFECVNNNNILFFFFVLFGFGVHQLKIVFSFFKFKFVSRHFEELVMES